MGDSGESRKPNDRLEIAVERIDARNRQNRDRRYDRYLKIKEGKK